MTTIVDHDFNQIFLIHLIWGLGLGTIAYHMGHVKQVRCPVVVIQPQAGVYTILARFDGFT